MPVPFPVKDPDNGAITMVDYFTTAEVAAMFHVSVQTVRRHCQNGDWPRLRSRGFYFLSADDIDQVHRLMRGESEPLAFPRLAVAVDPVDLEGVR